MEQITGAVTKVAMKELLDSKVLALAYTTPLLLSAADRPALRLVFTWLFWLFSTFFEQLTPGGQVLQTESLENYPGYPQGIKGYELADLFAAHLDGLDIDRPTGAVESVSGAAGRFNARRRR